VMRLREVFGFGAMTELRARPISTNGRFF